MAFKGASKQTHKGTHSGTQNGAASDIIVAAVDFGTTFSGYAFSFRHEFESDPLRVSSSQWTTGSRVAISLKTSTCVLFDPSRRFHSFGFDAEEKYCDLTYDGLHTDWYYFRRFKMMLYNKNTDIHRTTMLTDESGSKEMPAMEVFSAAIGYLREHLLSSLRDRMYDVRSDEVKWVLTVPAIWSDAAKQFTREAAEKAGIKGDRLVLALEPEAASMFCKYLPLALIDSGKDEITCFKPGSKYLVLDAGGGTVDITVHEVQTNGTLHELYKANGGPWGGTTVDTEFLDFIARITGKQVFERFQRENADDYMDLLREFEVKKRVIRPDLDSRLTFKVPISLHDIYREMMDGKDLRSAVKDIPEYAHTIMFAGDKLRADPEVVKLLFKKTCDEIIRHLSGILTASQTSGVTSILMVGGFSESPMIRHAVTAAFPQQRVICPNEAGLAVLKGAVIFGHNQNIITKRISKYTYGLKIRSVYNPDLHSKERMYRNARNECMVHGVFAKLVEVGEPVSADKPCIGDSRYSPLGKHDTGFTLKLFASPDRTPMYVDEEGCISIGEVSVDCRDKRGGVSSATVNLIFGKTELEVEAVNADTGEITRAAFDFLG